MDHLKIFFGKLGRFIKKVILKNLLSVLNVICNLYEKHKLWISWWRKIRLFNCIAFNYAPPSKKLLIVLISFFINLVWKSKLCEKAVYAQCKKKYCTRNYAISKNPYSYFLGIDLSIFVKKLLHYWKQMKKNNILMLLYSF